jgi:hypothetical protein
MYVNQKMKLFLYKISNFCAIAHPFTNSISQKRLVDKFAEIERAIDGLRDLIPLGLKEILARFDLQMQQLAEDNQRMQQLAEDYQQMQNEMREEIELLTERVVSLELRNSRETGADDFVAGATSGKSSDQSRNTMLQVCVMWENLLLLLTYHR